MALIPPHFLDAVVAIGFPRADDAEPHFSATGFLYGRFLREGPGERRYYRVFLISNKHVFEGERVAHLRFNPSGTGAARTFELPLTDAAGQPVWFGHADPEIDVAAARVSSTALRTHGIQFEAFLNDIDAMAASEAGSAGLSEGDPVFVLGFPLGLVGGKRNHVIVRQGCIARVRDLLARLEKKFLLDCPVFPGNSGGPVVLKPQMLAVTGTKAIRKARLIGIVRGYLPYEEIAVSEQTGLPRVTFQENSGLTEALPVDVVDAVVNSIPDDLAEDDWSRILASEEEAAR